MSARAKEGAALLADPAQPWMKAVLTHLQRQHEMEALEDCPLPALFELSRGVCADLTIGEFHDGLRVLHENKQIDLHPWTGSLYDLPEPALALPVGYEIVYYASAGVQALAWSQP